MTTRGMNVDNQVKKPLSGAFLSRSFGFWVAGLALASVSATPAEAIVTLKVMTSDAVPGGTLPLILSVERADGDPSTASTQLDLIYRTDQLELSGFCSNGGEACETNDACGEGVCELLCDKDGRLVEQSFNATFPEFQNVDPGEKRVRLRLLAPIQVELPLPTFDDGLLAMCMLQVAADATTGVPIELQATRVEVGDEESNVVPAEVVIEAGNIVVSLPTATPTPSETATETEIPTPTPTPTTSEGTPTRTATPEVPTATPTQGGGGTPTATEVPPTQVPTSTPVTPQATATPEQSTPTMVPTATATMGSGSTPTATQPTATPTTEGAKRRDDDGCAITQSPAQHGGSGLMWLLLPFAALVGMRRRANSGARR